MKIIKLNLSRLIKELKRIKRCTCDYSFECSNHYENEKLQEMRDSLVESLIYAFQQSEIKEIEKV